MDKDKNKDNSSEITELQKTSQDQANTIAQLENKIKQLSDPNKTPKIIQKGSQVHPKYLRNKTKIAATIPKETIPVKE